MAATWDNNIVINLLRTAGAVARKEFGLVCYGSNDTTFSVGVHKIYESIGDINDDALTASPPGELSAQAVAAGQAFFGQDNHPPRFMICEASDDTVPGDLASSLDAAYLAQPFYCITMQTKADADLIATDVWAGLNFTQAWLQTSSATALAGGAPMSTIDTAATQRSLVVYHATDTAELAVALAAEYFVADPDTTVTTAAYQQVSGFTPDTVTPTEKAAVEAVNGNLYLTFGSVGALYGGTMGGGDFADQTMTRDWFSARVKEGCQQLLLDKASLKTKVPYTDAGIAMFEGVIKAVQERGENLAGDASHFIKGASTTTVPELKDISAAVRASRALTIAGQSTMSGAIQTATVNLSVLNA
jgi:hypothetical protein